MLQSLLGDPLSGTRTEVAPRRTPAIADAQRRGHGCYWLSAAACAGARPLPHKSAIAQATPDAQRLHRLGHVMDSQQLHARLGALERERDRAAEPLFHRRLVAERADQPLAARPQHHRAPEAV